jgi:membrane-associated phospholipid phosphatase
MRPQSPTKLLAVSVAGLIGYVLVARAVSRRRTAGEDRKVRERIQQAREPEADAMAEVVSRIGKEWLHIPAAAVLGGVLLKKGAGSRAALPLIASVTSDMMSRLFDRLPPNRRPPPGHPAQDKPTFPSGHANETTAVALTSAYVLAREGMVNATPAFAVATIMAVASPGTRMYLDRHWTTDVFGGWCLGISLAAACAATYELASPRE